MTGLLRHVVLFLSIRGALGAESTRSGNDTKPATTTEVTTTASASTIQSSAPLFPNSVSATCQARTVNYITHTLPQQCLRTDRVPHTAPPPKTRDVTLPITTSSQPSEKTVTLTKTIQPSTDTSTLDVTASNDRDQATVDATSTPISSVATSSQDGKIPAPSAEVEEDAESPLDNANFLSFEEWKKQNLAKIGQSLEDLGRGRPVNANRQRPGINNALDTLGEDQEISLNFAGFGGGSQMSVAESHTSQSSTRPSSGPLGGQQDSPAQSARSKDAGKTCKERSNYASFDCAATILKSNKECKSASSVLVENKDSYMLNTCSAANKFFIVELCDVIQIDTIVLANYEFFSSSFRHFRVSASDRYPVKEEKWRDLGTFEARNTREIQAFLVQNPVIWARVVRIEFLSHYGTEYYCPVSVLRVHGTTMLEEFRHQEELATGEEEEATLDVEVLATPPVVQEPMQSTVEAAKATPQAIPDVDASKSALATETAQDSQATTSTAISDVLSVPTPTSLEEASLVANVTQPAMPPNVHAAIMTNLKDGNPATSSTEVSLSTAQENPSQTAVQQVSNTSTNEVAHSEQVHTPSSSSPAISSNSAPATVDVRVEGSRNVSETIVSPSGGTSSTANETASTIPSSHSTLSTNTTRASTSTTAPQPPQPSTQESFFKSFHKRLQQLESNSTLSLQYIEEQSRILRDAFTKVEKRQLTTTTKFLSQLNSTVMAELHGFRQAYDQLWQSTVIELEGQREAYQSEMLALSTRLTMVADELVWQKRMGIIQSTLLLLCLALAIFGRSENGYLEVPLMQQMMNKSTTALRGNWDSPPNSPSPDSRSPVSLFRRKLWRASGSPDPDGSASDSETSRPHSNEHPGIVIEPASPNARDMQDEYHDEQDTHMSPEKVLGEDKFTSPKKRKKSKKPHGSPHVRAKSPLAS